jgi:aminoglycoside 3-N-acetyltransferase
VLKKIGQTLRDQAKDALKEVRLAARSHTEPRCGREELAAGFRALGVEPGDTVFVHSSLKSLGYVEGGPIAVFEGLWDALGPDGTMIVPTYYLPGGTIANAAKDPDYVFDPSEHGSNLGALPAAFLGFPGVRRSLHPTHSVSAVGRHAGFVTADHHRAASVFGEGSPWQRFVELDGKLLGIGISMGPVTFYHRLEDEMGDRFPLPVKRPETHRLRARDATGTVHEVPVRAFHVEYMQRRIDNPSRKDVRDYFWRECTHAGLLREGRVGAARCWWTGAQSFHAHLGRLAAEGITIYASPEDMERRGWPPLDPERPPPE